MIYNLKAFLKNLSACQYLLILCFVLMILSTSKAGAQYYGYPEPVPVTKESELKSRLINSQPEIAQVNILLDLANLKYNKALRKEADINAAREYAEQARQLSSQLNYRPGYFAAQIRMAEILSDLHKVPEAEALLPELSGTARINMLLTLSYKNFYEADAITDDYYHNALKYAGLALDSSVKMHDKEKEIIARTLLTYFRFYGNYPGMEKDFKDILKECDRIHYPFKQYVYLSMFPLYIINGSYDKGFQVVQKAYELEIRRKNPLALGDCYGAFSNYYRNTKQLQKAIDYFKLAIAEEKVHRGMFGDNIPRSVIEVSGMLRSMHKYREALAYMQKSMPEVPASKADKARYERELGRIYQNFDVKLAEVHMLRSYNYLYSIHEAFFRDNFEMAQFYVDTRSYPKARPYLDRIANDKQKLPVTRRSLLEYLYFKVDSAAGNLSSAITHLSRNKELDNSYLTEKNNHDIQELNVKYDTKKKEDQIKMLDQNAALEKGNVKRLNLIKNVTLGGIILVLVIACLLYRQSTLRKKNNRVILKKNKLLEKLLTEKEWLLKEVHHRVKNNLHTVVCLLESQAISLTGDALTAIENCQHRIYAMSLIHQKLYQSDDIKTVNMGNFLPEFIGYLRDSLESSSRIRFEIAVEPIKLGVSYALPLSLIINEAVTNAIKYAFPGKAKGTISIRMHNTDRAVQLVIADDGIGIDPVRLNTSSNSLGLKLIKGLSDDIQGDVKILNQKGTVIVLDFMINSLTDNYSD